MWWFLARDPKWTMEQASMSVDGQLRLLSDVWHGYRS